MSDQCWYIYQNNSQLGPFTAEQIKQMLDTSMIAQDAYLFKVGWKDWLPVEETMEELGLGGTAKDLEPPTEERRQSAPRATIKGRVVVHNNGQLAIGSGVNISSSGMFVETKDQLFKIGETLKLSVKVEGFSKPFNTTAHVIRYNSDPRYSVGYGLKFEGLDEKIALEIQKSVDNENLKRSGMKKAK